MMVCRNRSILLACLRKEIQEVNEDALAAHTWIAASISDMPGMMTSAISRSGWKSQQLNRHFAAVGSASVVSGIAEGHFEGVGNDLFVIEDKDSGIVGVRPTCHLAQGFPDVAEYRRALD
jgi:hypothetical protein